MKRRRTLFVALGVIVVAAIGLALALGRGGSATPVREVVVTRQTFTTKLSETGVVQLPRTATIPAGTPGNVAAIVVAAGDHVRAGQVLARIVNDQIDNGLRDAEANVQSSSGRADSIAETNATLPKQNRSAVVQAQAAVVAATSQLTQARQDAISGSQSGLGYGGQTAESQRLDADATISKAKTDLDEAKRTYDANNDLYANKGVSRDVLLQSKARYDQALVTYEQVEQQRKILGGTLERESQVLHDRVRSAEDQLRQARAALAAAQATAASSKAGDLVAARADTSRATADLAYARSQEDRLTVRAPFDGIVLSVASQSGDSLRPLGPGDSVVAGQPLFTLSENERFIVRTRVDEQDIASVALGQRAIVSGEDFAGREIPGRVAAISPIAQKADDPSNTSRQVVTTIALERDPAFLRDGMSVDVDIVTARVPDALAVPIDALRKDERGTFVLLAKDGRAVRTPVALGTQNDTLAVVSHGLRDGDTVVVSKDASVVDGSPISAASDAAPSASPSG